MPVKSAKQFRFMHAAKNGDIQGVMPSVGKEMLEKTPEDKKSKFAKAFRRIKSKIK